MTPRGLREAGLLVGVQRHPYRSNGRPIAQWSRLRAGRSDDLGTAVA